MTAGNGGYSALLSGEPLTVPVFASSRESSGEEVPYRHRHRGEKACGNERYHCTSDVSYSCDLIIPDNQQEKKKRKVYLGLECEETIKMRKTWEVGARGSWSNCVHGPKIQYEQEVGQALKP